MTFGIVQIAIKELVLQILDFGHAKHRCKLPRRKARRKLGLLSKALIECECGRKWRLDTCLFGTLAWWLEPITSGKGWVAGSGEAPTQAPKT